MQAQIINIRIIVLRGSGLCIALKSKIEDHPGKGTASYKH